MINDIVARVRQDSKLYNYLKYHSYWYKILTNNPEKLKDMIKEMRVELKETFEDKLSDINNKMKYIGTIIELLS